MKRTTLRECFAQVVQLSRWIDVMDEYDNKVTRGGGVIGGMTPCAGTGSYNYIAEHAGTVPPCHNVTLSRYHTVATVTRTDGEVGHCGVPPYNEYYTHTHTHTYAHVTAPALSKSMCTHSMHP